MSTTYILHMIRVLDPGEAVPTASVPEVAAPVEAADEVPLADVERPRKYQPSRDDTVGLTVHFPRAVRQALRMIAAETDRQLQDVVAEGLNMVFRAYGKPEIAPRSSDVGED